MELIFDCQLVSILHYLRQLLIEMIARDQGHPLIHQAPRQFLKLRELDLTHTQTTTIDNNKNNKQLKNKRRHKNHRFCQTGLVSLVKPVS